MQKYTQGIKRLFLILLLVIFLFPITACEQNEYQQPQHKNILEVVFASGHITTEGQYNVISAVDGYIKELPVKEGMAIPDAYVLAEIEQESSQAQLNDAQAGYAKAINDADPNSPKIQELEKKIAMAKKEIIQDERVLESYERLVKINAVSKVEYENQVLKTERSRKDLAVLKDSKEDLLRSLELNLKNADNLLKIRKNDIKNYQLRAKGESQILKMYHEEGQYIRRGELLAEMGRGKYIVKLFVEESEINRIDKGQKVEISINTYQGKLFAGEITHIYPAFDEVQQSFIVEAQFIEQPELLFSGTQVQANIVTSQKKNALVIPRSSLVSENQVMTKNNGLVKLQLGTKSMDWVEVLDGITKEEYIKVNSKK